MLWSRDGYTVTDDRAALDTEVVFGFLSESYWAKGIPRETCLRSLENSLCFGLLHGGQQAGFCRVVTDRATFAYLADVFVLPEHRGRGLGKWLVACVLAHPELQGLRRFLLATLNAHGLYSQVGFAPMSRPELFMEIVRSYDARPDCCGGGCKPES
ncbi:MAG: GNAT family N-acetyltransferase [Humidesulfovibrio sp.]